MKGYLKFAAQLTGVWCLVMGVVFVTFVIMVYFVKLLEAWELVL